MSALATVTFRFRDEREARDFINALLRHHPAAVEGKVTDEDGCVTEVRESDDERT